MPQSPQEEVRQVAARFLVESLGYPKEDLAADVPFSHNHREPFTAALVVTREGEETPFIIVEVAPPGSAPSSGVPPAVAESGARFYFWFDGFQDDPRRGPISWGTRYFESRDGGFVLVPALPHHHRAARQRHRRRPTRLSCPQCGRRLDFLCAFPCTDECRLWSCFWYGLAYCPTCQRSWPRPRPKGQRK